MSKAMISTTGLSADIHNNVFKTYMWPAPDCHKKISKKRKEKILIKLC